MGWDGVGLGERERDYIIISNAALSPPEKFYMRDEGGEAGGVGGGGEGAGKSDIRKHCQTTIPGGGGRR